MLRSAIHSLQHLSRLKQYSLLQFLLTVSHAFCIILHMKLFTKETLIHTSLYRLQVTHRDRGRLGGRWGRGDFFFLECASAARGCPRKAKAREETEGRKKGPAAGEHIEQRHWWVSPPSPKSRKQADVSSAQAWAQTLQKAMLES